MQFLYHQEAGKDFIHLKEENFKYLIKVRRSKIGDFINISNFKNNEIFIYSFVEINKKEANLKLESSKINEIKIKKNIFGWGVIDSKIIEKTLPLLNEMGVYRLSFIYMDFSQRQFKINLDKLKRICINSSQQCGRLNLMEFEVFDNLKEFLAKYPNSTIIDFSQYDFSSIKKEEIHSLIVGPEGGFSENEKEILKNHIKIGFDTPLILRSETAILGIASKILI